MTPSTRVALARRERELRFAIADHTEALRSPESAIDRNELLRRRNELIDNHIKVSIALARAQREARREDAQRALPL